MNEERNFQRPETVPLYSNVKDWSTPQQYVDPTTSIEIAITNPDGTVKQAATAMTKLETGKYVYYHLTSLSDQVGWYPVVVTVQDGAGGGARVTVQNGGFWLE
ncbi:MAG: hypothetical protein ACWGQW_00335 [bacterium]